VKAKQQEIYDGLQEEKDRVGSCPFLHITIHANMVEVTGVSALVQGFLNYGSLGVAKCNLGVAKQIGLTNQ